MVNAYAHLTGGADHHCLALAKGLRARGHQVSFLSTASLKNIEHDGSFVELTVSNHSRNGLPLQRRARVAAAALWNREAANAMRSMIRDHRPDIVHAHKLYPQLSVAPLVVSGHMRVPVVQTLHDYELIAASAIDDHGGWLDRDESRLEYRVLNDVTYLVRRTVHARQVRTWIAISRFLAGIYDRHGISCRVLPNFTDPPRDAPVDFADRRGAVFAGRLTEVKGVNDVLELARCLPEVPVTVVGDGPLSATVRSAAAELSNLEFRGRVDRPEVERLLRSARVLLMPSRWQEPGGLSALEAMAAGTPVVAFDVGGLAEYVRDAGGGLTVEMNSEALIEGCRRMLTNEAEWRLYSERGIAATSETHSPERYFSEIEDVYRAAKEGPAHV